jgi:hypothetical protein
MGTIQFPRLNVILLLTGILLTGQKNHAQDTSYFDTAFTGYFRLNSGGWTAGDATLSVPLPDHRVIWLFGDSYLADVDTANNTLPCLFQVRNCMMVQDSADLSLFHTITDSNHTGVNRSTFKLRLNDTTLFWPGHGYFRKDTVYLFLERYSNSDMGLFYGEYIAKLSYPDLHLTGIYPVQLNTQYFFGRAVIADTSSQTLYIYGNRLNWIVWEPVVARCGIDQVQGPWEYYDGSGWSSSIDASQKISSDPVSPGFSVFFRNNKYYLVTQENGYLTCGLGREIYSYESDSPQGPFVNRKLLYTEESMFNGRYLLTYNAQAHPFFTKNEELLISYNVNDRVDTLSSYPCPSECVNIWTDRLDADSYRPKFVRVPMGILTQTPERTHGIKDFGIFPNPVKAGAVLTIRCLHAGNEIREIGLMDPEGRDLGRRFLLEDGSSRITTMAPETSGVYLLRLTRKDNFPVVLKLIVI